MRRATRLRWICDVPPMTLCARLYRYTFDHVSSAVAVAGAADGDGGVADRLLGLGHEQLVH